MQIATTSGTAVLKESRSRVRGKSAAPAAGARPLAHQYSAAIDVKNLTGNKARMWSA